MANSNSQNRPGKLTLLQQALAEEKKLLLEEYSTINSIVSIDIIKSLLPNYKPLPQQQKFHSSLAFERGIKGGYQSGKTTAFCAEAIALGYINRPYPILLVSPSYDLVVDVVAEKLKLLCDENKLEYEFLSSKGFFVIKLSNDDVDNIHLYLAGSDKPRFLKGYTVAAAGMDEPFIQSKEAYEIINSRISKKTNRNNLFWSGTPEPQYMEWGMDYFEKDHDEKSLFTITLPTKANKHLPKEYLDNLKKKYDAKLQEVYLEGRFIMLTANRAYHCFNRSLHVVDTTKENRLKEYDELILSFDFNVDPMTAVLVVLKGKVFYEVKEWSLSSSNTAELCAAVIVYLTSINERLQNSIIITGDATGRRRGTRGYMSDYEIIRDEFTKAGINFYFNIPHENPPVRDRINFVNKLFEREMYFIDERCIKTIKDRELVCWKQSGEGFLIDKSKKDLTHLSDCGDYAVFNNQILLSELEGEGRVYIEYKKRR